MPIVGSRPSPFPRSCLANQLPHVVNTPDAHPGAERAAARPSPHLLPYLLHGLREVAQRLFPYMQVLAFRVV